MEWNKPNEKQFLIGYAQIKLLKKAGDQYILM